MAPYLISRNQLFTALLAVLSIFSSCTKEDLPPVEVPDENSFFVLCEGNYNWGNASITAYDVTNEVLTQEYFQLVNSYALGDVAQSIFENEDYYFIVVNNSGKVEVVDKQDFSVIYTLTGFNSPRFLQTINDSIAYVSDLFSGEVSIINFINGNNVGAVEVNSWSEQMQKVADSVYVCLYDLKSIGIINSLNHQLTGEISLAKSPSQIRVDAEGMLWVLASDWGEGSILYKIDPLSRDILSEWTFEEANTLVQLEIAVNGNWVYLLSSTGEVYKFSSLTSTVITPIFSVNLDGLYGLDVDEDGGIYICDAHDFVQNGTVNKYSESGLLQYSIESGVSPNSIVFR
jgi:DNA-binding beta-propeller fold protein YncE